MINAPARSYCDDRPKTVRSRKRPLRARWLLKRRNRCPPPPAFVARHAEATDSCAAIPTVGRTRKGVVTYVRVVDEFFHFVRFSSRPLFSVSSDCFVVRLIRFSRAPDPRWKKKKEMIAYLARRGLMRSPSPLSCCCPPSLVVNAVSVVLSSLYNDHIPTSGSQN